MASAKHTTFNTTQALAFMNNCLVELFAMEDERGSAYQFAFVSIRQLAIQLRAATTQHTQDTLQQVLNWQFIHAIRLWSRLIATVQTAAQNQKHSGAFDKLIFPLTQIAMGAVGLNSRRGPQFYLYQLHLLRALSDLSFRTQVFIPIVPHILEIIAELAADAGKIQPSTLKSIDVSTTLRAPKSMVHSKLYSDTVFDECMDLMMEALSAQCTSIAFPELVSSWTVRMKRIAKQTIVPRFNKQLMGLVQELERQRSVVQTRRRSRSVAFGPCDGDNCKRFALDGAADLNSAVRQTDLGRYVMACKRVREQRRLAMAANK
jgi:nucleolar complex protein 2